MASSRGSAHWARLVALSRSPRGTAELDNRRLAVASISPGYASGINEVAACKGQDCRDVGRIEAVVFSALVSRTAH